MSLFVPLVSSLSDDAPGYNSEIRSNSEQQSTGPLCWKCHGRGTQKTKTSEISCKVCKGLKRLGVKKDLVEGREQEGEITKVTVPADWIHYDASSSPVEIELNNGEQLCGLIAGYRIIQHKGGHRWTTDDICTAWVAMKSVTSLAPILQKSGDNTMNYTPLRYLDLGCGNGSVLLMVSVHLPIETTCIGIEARSEAVNLARRSILYNCGPNSERITIRNADFRSVINYKDNDLLPEGPTFDLVTGTPPYFRVNFHVDPETKLVGKALIQQGGFPTCKESAPARCEFRGGIEAYLEAAATVLSPRGIFVVCENWLNHDRVLQSANDTGLFICSIQRVIGKEGKTPLFCVYTLIRNNVAGELVSEFFDEQSITKPDLIVRDSDGAWTTTYADMLREMKYPVASLHPSGKY